MKIQKKSNDNEQNKISPLENNSDSNKFDWGILSNNSWLIDALIKEFSDKESNYEKFFKVEENDIV